MGKKWAKNYIDPANVLKDMRIVKDNNAQNLFTARQINVQLPFPRGARRRVESMKKK